MWIYVDLIWIIGFLAHSAGGSPQIILARKTGKWSRRHDFTRVPELAGKIYWKRWCLMRRTAGSDVLFNQPNEYRHKHDRTTPFDVNPMRSLPWKPEN